MQDPAREARRWLEQAENDLAFAKHALAGGFFHQVCFISQQCAEKSLKAVLIRGGARSVIGHSVVGLLERAKARHSGLARLSDLAADLDLLYIPTRYPNGLPEGAPHQAFTRSQAERALAAAGEFLEAARSAFAG